MSRELRQYIEDALQKGADRQEIYRTLVDNGWSADLVAKTLDRYKGVDSQGLLIPAPKTRFHHIVRDIFVYLLTVATLFLAAYALGDLLFRLVERWIPDMALDGTYRHDSRSTHWFVAQLVVAFPVYAFLAWWTARDVAAHPEKGDSLVRKLMIYFILYVTAIVAVGDFITVLYNFLNGDLTLHFIFKALVVLALAAVIFVYYFIQVRGDDAGMQSGEDLAGSRKSSPFARRLFAGTVVVVVLAIAGGIAVTGGPSYQRLVQLDEKRLSHLATLSDAIDRYYHQHESRLPEDLDSLHGFMATNLDESNYMRSMRDPDTGNVYEYKVLDDNRYNLCAAFATASNEGSEIRYSPYRRYGSFKSYGFQKGHHPKGHHCYEFYVEEK